MHSDVTEVTRDWRECIEKSRSKPPTSDRVKTQEVPADTIEVRFFKSQEQKQQIASARAEFDTFIKRSAGAPPEAVRAMARAFEKNPNIASLETREKRRLSDEAFRRYTENVLADDHLTIDEEMAFSDVCGALGVSQGDLAESYPELFCQLAVARVNDGRLGVVESPHVMIKSDEVVHLEAAAGLLKEVAIREWQSGSTGFSIPIAKGVRYRTGSTRGRSVVVGTELQVEDAGILSVTSKRICFMGSRKTVEILYAKLIGIELFTDGVRLSASNRQRPPLFKLANGMSDVVGATLNVAVVRAQ